MMPAPRFRLPTRARRDMMKCPAKRGAGRLPPPPDPCDPYARPGLILTKVTPENMAGVSGFEHHTFICSGCHSTVRRVVFLRHGREEDPKLPPNLFDHVMARVRGY